MSISVVPLPFATMARPVLRPGLRVVRRDDGHLQLGLDEPDRLVLPDRPGLLESLTHLDRVVPPHLTQTLGQLASQGWVVDATAQQEAGVRRRASRAAVAVEGDADLTGTMSRLCTRAGIPLQESSAGLLRVIVSRGEPRRERADALMRDDTPHLWVTALDGGIRVGPFVDPGRSTCLRCIDAHLGDLDPRRATVLHQLEQDPPPSSPVDPTLLVLGAAWAVRDLARVLDGAISALRSRTVTVSNDLEVTARTWLRHPHCGCAWG